MIETTCSVISYQLRYVQALLEYQYIYMLMESLPWENGDHFFFWRKISFLTDRHCIVLEVFQGMEKV